MRLKIKIKNELETQMTKKLRNTLKNKKLIDDSDSKRY